MKSNESPKMGNAVRDAFLKSLFQIPILAAISIILMLVADSSSVAQSTSGSTNRQTPEVGQTRDQNLRSVARVNPSTLAMEMDVSLGAYPGRNGNSFPFNFSYSSKVWKIKSGVLWWYSTPGGIRRYVNDVHSIYGERTAAGWTSSLLPPRLDTELLAYDQYGKSFNFELDEVQLAPFYQSLEGTVLAGEPQANLIVGPQQCGLICTGGWTNVCIDGHCSNWSCSGYSFFRCHTTFDDPDPQQPNIPNPRYMHYVKRISIQMHDGSMHEFRKSDKVFGYCAGSNNPYNGQNCEQDGEDTIGDYLAVDGSGMRLKRSSNSSTLYMPSGAHYVFPSLPLHGGQQWYATEYIDADGNKMKFSQQYDSNENVTNKWTDTLARELVDPLPHNWAEQTQAAAEQQVDLPGLGETSQQYILKWLKLKGTGINDSALEDPNQPLSYEMPFICRGNLTSPSPPTGSTNGILFGASTLGVRLCNPVTEVDGNIEASLFNPTVLGEIVLPNGKSYKFRYNRYGEISRIDYPSGSYETFIYEKIIPLGGANSNVFDQTNRGVVERRVYDVDHTLIQRWQYSASINNGVYPIPANTPYKVTTIAPKKTDPCRMA
jgi:hypothetical protein